MFNRSSQDKYKNQGEELVFVHSIKQYLCLSLSRNIVSVVPQIFDIAIQLFMTVLAKLRSKLKVFFANIKYLERIIGNFYRNYNSNY